MRGTREACSSERDARHRFIPACAGNTCNAGGSAVLRGNGSSPPVRGTHRRLRLGCPGIGAVHPRLCGEHPFKSSFGLRITAGSSPPVRGTPSQVRRCHACSAVGSSPPVRGTPHGGDRPFLASASGSSPPVRGTRPGCAGDGVHVSIDGSSPPVRGTHTSGCGGLP